MFHEIYPLLMKLFHLFLHKIQDIIAVSTAKDHDTTGDLLKMGADSAMSRFVRVRNLSI